MRTCAVVASDTSKVFRKQGAGTWFSKVLYAVVPRMKFLGYSMEQLPFPLVFSIIANRPPPRKRFAKKEGASAPSLHTLFDSVSAATTQRYIGIEPQKIEPQKIEQAIQNHAQLL